MNPKTLTISQIHAGLKQKQFSSSEITKAYLARCQKLSPTLNAFLTITEDEALAAAANADKIIAAGRNVHPLTGVPAAIKDVIVTKGIRTTAASRTLTHYIPPYDATVIEKLKSLHYVPLGKTNCDEFAMGSSNENSAFDSVANPWDLERVPGGSSGGSAAAVAAGLAPYALGTDTGGSIRQPASLSGVVGLKPTYGRVSRYGAIALASSLDQIGCFTHTVEDAETVFSVIQGYDPRDATSIDSPPHEVELKKACEDLKIGIPLEYVGKDWSAEGIELEVLARVREAISQLQKLGARVIEVSLSHTPYIIAVYRIIADSEASSHLARYDGIHYGETFLDNEHQRKRTLYEQYEETRRLGFGPEAKRRIILGTYALSAGYYDAYYRKAQAMRDLIREDFDRAFEQIDVIASPTSPTVAFPLGAKTVDPLAMYLADIFTVAANLAGLPAISLPCGFAPAPNTVGAENFLPLPVGLQLIGRRFDEATLFAAGKAYQSVTDHHLKTPPTPN